MRCPVCTADRSVDETSQIVYGRDANPGDYFVCRCSTVLVLKGEPGALRLVEPTAADLWDLRPHEFSILWHARRRIAQQLEHAQGGRV